MRIQKKNQKNKNKIKLSKNHGVNVEHRYTRMKTNDSM